MFSGWVLYKHAGIIAVVFAKALSDTCVLILYKYISTDIYILYIYNRQAKLNILQNVDLLGFSIVFVMCIQLGNTGLFTFAFL